MKRILSIAAWLLPCVTFAQTIDHVPYKFIGDTNGDGFVTVADVTDVVNRAVTNTYEEVPLYNKEYVDALEGRVITLEQQIRRLMSRIDALEDIHGIEEPVPTTYTINGVDYPIPEFIDLGLPSGNLWMSCDVGSNNPKYHGVGVSSDDWEDFDNIIEGCKVGDFLELCELRKELKEYKDGYRYWDIEGYNGNHLYLPYEDSPGYWQGSWGRPHAWIENTTCNNHKSHSIVYIYFSSSTGINDNTGGQSFIECLGEFRNIELMCNDGFCKEVPHWAKKRIRLVKKTK